MFLLTCHLACPEPSTGLGTLIEQISGRLMLVEILLLRTSRLAHSLRESVFRRLNWSKFPRFQAESWFIRRDPGLQMTDPAWRPRGGQNDGMFTYILFTPCFDRSRWSGPRLTVGGFCIIFAYSGLIFRGYPFFIISLRIFPNCGYESHFSLGFAICYGFCSSKTCAWWGRGFTPVKPGHRACKPGRMHSRLSK